MILSGFCLACFQNTVKSLCKEQQLIELSAEDAQDAEDDSESLKKEWNDDLFSEWSQMALLSHYSIIPINRIVHHTNYFSFIKPILTPPPRA
ncbi:MAG: hypothetical protein HY062_18490 [Bacteroidetes bacterium]|nr:hypothetical protein [Bacteroidota bacterium]